MPGIFGASCRHSPTEQLELPERKPQGRGDVLPSCYYIHTCFFSEAPWLADPPLTEQMFLQERRKTSTGQKSPTLSSDRGAGELARWVRRLAARAENQSLVHSISARWPTTACGSNSFASGTTIGHAWAPTRTRTYACTNKSRSFKTGIVTVENIDALSPFLLDNQSILFFILSIPRNGKHLGEA